MTALVVALAAVLLSFERLCYLFAWRRPDSFRVVALRLRIASGAVTALERVFLASKVVQIGVFALWWTWFSRGGAPRFTPNRFALTAGVLLIAAGQLLNAAAMLRLGRIGMFYGVRFGYSVPRCRKFPYSIIPHPQYTGAVASIWGIFLAIRFPSPDWIVVPLIETLYYVLGSILENDAPRPTNAASTVEPTPHRITAPRREKRRRRVIATRADRVRG